MRTKRTQGPGSIDVSLSFGYAAAEEFGNKEQENAIAIIDPAIKGADKFVFFCAPQTHCGGERYKVIKEDGVDKWMVTFKYGEGNTIKVRPKGNNYRMVHIRKSNGKVTKIDLTPTAWKPPPFPDVTLFNPQWGEKGTHVKVTSDRLEYCCRAEPCNSGTLITVGDRLGIAYIGMGNHVLLGRQGQDRYSVALHRASGESFHGLVDVVDP